MAGLLIVDTLSPTGAVHRHPFFLALLALLFVNLTACTLRRWDRLDLPVLLTHLGALLILAGAAVTWQGAQRGHLTLRVGGEPSRLVHPKDSGRTFSLPFEVRLLDFRLEYDGDPRHVVRWSDPETGRSGGLEGQPPTRHPLPAMGVTLEVLAFNPDLIVGAKGVTQRSNEPRNPALQVRWIEGRQVSAPFWLFAFFPDAHPSPRPLALTYEFHPAPLKQYVSEVTLSGGPDEAETKASLWVNHPLRHRSWTLYQSAYDPNDLRSSTLEVVQDPGITPVYTGFGIFLLGLIAVTFRRRS